MADLGKGQEAKWSKFGLKSDQDGQESSSMVPQDTHEEEHLDKPRENELFGEQVRAKSSILIMIDCLIVKFNCQFEEKPWWRSKFLFSQPELFGTWDGVFTASVLHILGVITFIRSGWIVVSFQTLFMP